MLSYKNFLNHSLKLLILVTNSNREKKKYKYKKNFWGIFTAEKLQVFLCIDIIRNIYPEDKFKQLILHWIGS